MKSRRRRLTTRRGVFLLPAGFTVGNIFLGFFSIVESMKGDLATAALAIGLAILADLVDGRVARFASATSEFGRELDSLADMCSFGVAPAVLAYNWGLHHISPTGWLVAALFSVCSAVRLARFNVGRLEQHGGFYIGLPTPAAAALVGAVVFASPVPLEPGLSAVFCLIAMVALSVLLNSPIRYLSFKQLSDRRPQSWRMLPLLAGIIVAAIAEPVIVFLLLAVGFAIHPVFLRISRTALRKEVVRSPATGKTS